MRRSRRSRGFALITVLWVVVSATIVLLRSTLAGRDAFSTARNRALLARAAWHAEGCLETARALIDVDLRDHSTRMPLVNRWVLLDQRLGPKVDSLRATTDLWNDCALSMQAAGARVDVNTATAEQL